MPRNVQICLAKGEEMLVAQVLCKVLLHLTSTGETDFGPYANEYMIVLKMTDDGTHIKEVVEFIDSATTRDIAAGLAQHVKPRVIMGVGATVRRRWMRLAPCYHVTEWENTDCHSATQICHPKRRCACQGTRGIGCGMPSHGRGLQDVCQVNYY